MLSKYIELNHKVKEAKVIKRKNVPISGILQKIGQRRSEDVVESVIGSNQLIYPACNFNGGFLDTILTCYHNRWVLKTTPEDWWNIITFTVPAVIDQKSEVSSIREFFVSHEGKKQINIIVDGITDLDYNYSWLFTQFAEQIAGTNIRHLGYFTTTSPHQLITNLIMSMVSEHEREKYFNYISYAHTKSEFGIPGIEMSGTVKDWEKMVTKFESLRKMIEPFIKDLNLTAWFSKTKEILDKLVETYNGVPDRKWWSQILSDCTGWAATGWMSEFLRPDTNRPANFPSGVVSVPLVLIGGPYEDTGRNWWTEWVGEFLRLDTDRPVDFFSAAANIPLVLGGWELMKIQGILVGGIVGYTIEESTYNRPSVKAEHGWALLMPKYSPLTPIILGEKPHVPPTKRKRSECIIPKL